MPSRTDRFGPFTTTVVGSMPKPLWMLKRDPRSVANHDHGSEVEWAFEGDMLKNAQDDATRVMLQTQEQAGIDLVSDGEQRREYYITYVTRALGGLDYKTLAEKKIRSGRVGHVGRCTGPVTRREADPRRRRTLPRRGIAAAVQDHAARADDGRGFDRGRVLR